MITNTELEQIVSLRLGDDPWPMDDVVQMARELLCAREVIKYAKKVIGGSTDSVWCSRDEDLWQSLKAYDALCAPQEKTGEGNL